MARVGNCAVVPAEIARERAPLGLDPTMISAIGRERVYLMALPSRFNQTCLSRAGSHCTRAVRRC